MIDTPYTLIDIFKKHKKYFQKILTEDDFSGGNNGGLESIKGSSSYQYRSAF